MLDLPKGFLRRVRARLLFHHRFECVREIGHEISLILEPIESRIRLSLTPAIDLASALMLACVIVAA